MKEKITDAEVEYVAKLANLPLTDKEKEKLAKELSEVIGFNINLLKEVNTDRVEPTAHVGGISSKLRKDEPEPGLPLEEVLQNSKETHNGLFKVKAVLEEADERPL
jgi:aspartyl-tRNA(Asn)/glutamyl-tRNA(Gln) amidotransferase subunit C